MSTKQTISRKTNLVALFILLGALAVVGRVVHIQVVEGEKWRETARKQSEFVQRIEPVRGNILATDGSFLAISLPIYDVFWDLSCPGAHRDSLRKYARTLGEGLVKILKKGKASDYMNNIYAAQRIPARYYCLARGLRHHQVEAIKKLPILSMPPYKGGMIVESRSTREKPLGILASRTIGRVSANEERLGLEAAYDSELIGKQGLRFMEKLSKNVVRPVFGENAVEPEDGLDIKSSIDPEIQEVLENELNRQLIASQADHGTAVVMEVKTGYIRAIANLKRGDDGNYYESYNYAIGESIEPGSTMKLASMLALLEDGFVHSSDTIQTGSGELVLAPNVTLHDSKTGGHGKISVAKAFEVSSNIAMAKMVLKHYKNQPEKFLEHYRRLGLDKPTGIEIPGEGNPLVKRPGDEGWSMLTMPMMAIGYEIRQTPLQILTMFNGIANGGVRMKPLFVEAILERGKAIKTFPPMPLGDRMCSDTTLAQLMEMMTGVVQNGTASNLKGHVIPIAGKTGTVKISAGKQGYTKTYQASFCGFFPADNPSYSCIVAVTNPSANAYYGNVVAGPVFKKVADQVYSNSYKVNRFHYSKTSRPAALPLVYNGGVDQAKMLKKYLPVNIKVAVHRPTKDPKAMPDLQGWNVTDAVVALAERGISPRIIGQGKVRKQTPAPGTHYPENTLVLLELAP
jgi:cell division protein FtsI (penicillin-binding protein 3)